MKNYLHVLAAALGVAASLVALIPYISGRSSFVELFTPAVSSSPEAVRPTHTPGERLRPLANHEIRMPIADSSAGPSAYPIPQDLDPPVPNSRLSPITFSLVSGDHIQLRQVSATVGIEFSTVSQISFATVTVSSSEGLTRFPAMSTGAASEFKTDTGHYSVRLLALDWTRRAATLEVRKR